MLKKHLIGLIVVLCNVSSFAQVDSIQIDDEYYYVYPFRQEVEVHDDYWITVDDEAYFQDYMNYFIYFEERTGFTREKFANAEGEKLKRLNKQLKRKWGYYRKKYGRLSLGRRFVKNVRRNPTSLLDVDYSFNKEIIPPFKQIPNGKYVQLFQDFCLIDQKGKCQEQTARIAAYFSIKDNAIEGEAVWINVQGDTLKKGFFLDGLKEGSWDVKDVDDIPASLYRWSVKEFKKYGSFSPDTSYYIANYHYGVLHGEFYSTSNYRGEKTSGHYNNGKPSGDWTIKADTITLMKASYANSKDTLRSYKPIIRNGTLIPRYDYVIFDMEPEEYHLMNVPENFYKIGFTNYSDLELEEEQFQSHELEYERYGVYNDKFPSRLKKRFLLSGGYNYLQMETDPETGLYETRGYFIDSLGSKMEYDGDYEIYYPNGQLFTRYQFENGELVKERDHYPKRACPLLG